MAVILLNMLVSSSVRFIESIIIFFNNCKDNNFFRLAVFCWCGRGGSGRTSGGGRRRKATFFCAVGRKKVAVW